MQGPQFWAPEYSVAGQFRGTPIYRVPVSGSSWLSGRLALQFVSTEGSHLRLLPATSGVKQHHRAFNVHRSTRCILPIVGLTVEVQAPQILAAIEIG